MKIKKYLIAAIPVVAVIILNLYFRSYTINFPQLKAQARQAVRQSYQQGISQDVYKKFPQFYPAAKEKIIKNRVSEYERANKPLIDRQTIEVSRQMKDRFQDESGQTYLMELDCWHWSRYVENILRFGRPGDETVDGKQWDIFMLAPQGFYMFWDNFLYYLSAYLYKLFSVFKKVPLFTFLFYLPLLFAAAFVTVLYAFAYRLGKHPAGIIASLFVGLAPIFMQRSYAGWFDKDILSLLFPIAVIWTFTVAELQISLRRRLIWQGITGFLLGLFCFTWTHWWFVFFILFIYDAGHLGWGAYLWLFSKEKDKSLFQRYIFSTFTFVGITLLWVALICGKAPFAFLYEQSKLTLTLNKPLMASIWPNVFSTVGELRRVNIKEIASSIGGQWTFIISLVCVGFFLYQGFWKAKLDAFKRTAILILSIWLVAMMFASFRGVRFVVYILVPLGVCLGWACNEIYQYLVKKRLVLGYVFLAVSLLGIGWFTVLRAGQTAKYLYPLIDDTWYKVLTMIKEKTPEQTIINSWWDYGDWFKVIARRRVIFDGQSQGTPQAYWMARAILTPNEAEAAGILRMLNNGGNKAFEVINESLKNDLQSVLLLESVVALPPDKAQTKMLDFLPMPVVEKVMKLLFSRPANACFIAENSMVPKMGAISYLGNWMFTKVYIARNYRSQEKERILEYLRKLGKDATEVDRLYQEMFLLSLKDMDDWLSHRLQFYSDVSTGVEKDGLVVFNNGFVYNPKEQGLQSSSGQVPRSLFTLDGDNFVEVGFPNPNVIFSVLIYKTEEGYRCIYLDRELGASMFVRLYFFRGQGLKHFVPFIEVQQEQSFIRVFNINW